MSNKKARTRVPDDSTNVEAVIDACTISNETENKSTKKKTAVITGVVVNCPTLRIRTEPSKEGEVITTVPALAQLTIDLDMSTEDWFKVCYGGDIEGYCMKNFIAAKY